MTLPELDRAWPVRIRWTEDGVARAYARSQTFAIDSQASLRESDPQPSALEYLLGALGGDLMCGFRKLADAQSIEILDLEIVLEGRLQNVLVHLGVIGERGDSGLTSVTGSVYVSAIGDPEAVESAWRETLKRAPVYSTLARSVEMEIELKLVS